MLNYGPENETLVDSGRHDSRVMVAEACGLNLFFMSVKLDDEFSILRIPDSGQIVISRSDHPLVALICPIQSVDLLVMPFDFVSAVHFEGNFVCRLFDSPYNEQVVLPDGGKSRP